jgi:hypothetical protein
MADLKITRTIQTGVMFFIPANEDQYDAIENHIMQKFPEQPFGNVVLLNVDDAEFCQYYLTADVENEVEFNQACIWLLAEMEKCGAVLDYVS